MNIVTSLSVDRLHHESNPFWPPGIKRLVVIVSHPGHGRDTLIAYGIDPGPGPGRGPGRGRSRIVFEAAFPRTRLSGFLKAVIDGDKAVIDHHRTAASFADGAASSDELLSTAAREVVVTIYRELVEPGPQIALALAASIRSQERLAEAVASPAPPAGRSAAI